MLFWIAVHFAVLYFTPCIVFVSQVADFLHNPQGAKITDALDEVEQRRIAQLINRCR
jgi:CBS domain containing-hemolysin-like protein